MEQVRASSFHGRDLSLAGFVLSGRWPEATHEWAQLLTIAVRVAAAPGMLPTTTVFRSVDDLPEDPQPGTVGLLTRVGPVIGDDAARPGDCADPLPRALFVLHPPGETRPSLPEAEGSASGVVMLPGVPHLGLEHRAAWVEARTDGSLTRLMSVIDVDPWSDPDLAVLSTLIAA